MAGQRPTHRVVMTNKDDRSDRIELFAGWPAKKGPGVNLRPDRQVVGILIKEKDGEIVEVDPAKYWIDLKEAGGGQRREEPAAEPEMPSGNDWGSGSDIPF